MQSRIIRDVAVHYIEKSVQVCEPLLNLEIWLSLSLFLSVSFSCCALSDSELLTNAYLYIPIRKTFYERVKNAGTTIFDPFAWRSLYILRRQRVFFFFGVRFSILLLLLDDFK